MGADSAAEVLVKLLRAAMDKGGVPGPLAAVVKRVPSEGRAQRVRGEAGGPAHPPIGQSTRAARDGGDGDGRAWP